MHEPIIIDGHTLREVFAEMQDFYCRHSDWKVIREMQITAIEKSDTDEVKVSGEGELCGHTLEAQINHIIEFYNNNATTTEPFTFEGLTGDEDYCEATIKGYIGTPSEELTVTLIAIKNR